MAPSARRAVAAVLPAVRFRRARTRVAKMLTTERFTTALGTESLV
jgi:hypothetical protein